MIFKSLVGFENVIAKNAGVYQVCVCLLRQENRKVWIEEGNRRIEGNYPSLQITTTEKVRVSFDTYRYSNKFYLAE